VNRCELAGLAAPAIDPQCVNNDQMTQERADDLVAEVMQSIWAN